MTGGLPKKSELAVFTTPRQGIQAYCSSLARVVFFSFAPTSRQSTLLSFALIN